ncbi:MAG: CDP-alcohol phosphatidyltransferase family protein, partial [Candidatus Bathyarchaeia archaeon]
MLTKLKKKVQDALATEAKIAHKMGLTPNIVSTIGFLMAFLSATSYAAYENQPFRLVLSLVFLMASGFCDTLDGVLARTFNQASAFGGFLDSVLDRY